jgi:hypothetical protein
MRLLTLAALLASAALGQQLTRTYQLKNTSPTGMQEIATTLRSVFDVKTLSLDPTVSTLTVTGNPDQIALAEWLIPKLDVLPGTTPTPQKYLYAGNNNDVVEIYGLKNATVITDLQEVLTSLRTVVQIQKIYQLSPRLLILRADVNHMAMADFLIPLLDQPPATRTSPAIQSFPVPGGNGDSVIVYGLAHANTVFDLQEVLTTLRTVLNIQWIFQRTEPRLLSMRGNPSQIQMAEWLIPQLDQQTATGSGAELRAPTGNDDVLHVFYLADGTNVGDALKTVRQLQVPKAYMRSSLPALAVRGTADQIALVATSLPVKP